MYNKFLFEYGIYIELESIWTQYWQSHVDIKSYSDTKLSHDYSFREA